MLTCVCIYIGWDIVLSIWINLIDLMLYILNNGGYWWSSLIIPGT